MTPHVLIKTQENHYYF